MTKSLAGRKEKPRRVGDTQITSEKEASNRVGRNDRLGYGWEEVEAREWGGGQLVGSGKERAAVRIKKYRYPLYSVR